MPNEIRDKYKRFTEEELNKLFPNWKDELKSYTPSLKTIKPIIKNFNEFDENTKSIYLKIAKYIKMRNPTQTNLKVWATGSRVNGRWRTKEEAEIWAKETNQEVRYSDYDYSTNAVYVPGCKYNKSNDKTTPEYLIMSKFVGASIDRIVPTVMFKIPFMHLVEVPIE